ncbi:unnamed protein product [Rodentolepis nana]|uniref:Uroporphyrinogen decarboxylase (URO-D) domain-containing protein n=1 Tax=Rodentolepis nana TaxID=102285 RepID=A0A3P7WSA0_RODNA|nr:unnamed protein product [Rodentolepis nana]
MYSSSADLEKRVEQMLKNFGSIGGGSHRHIVNLGHGIYPDVDPEKVTTFVEAVHRLTANENYVTNNVSNKSLLLGNSDKVEWVSGDFPTVSLASPCLLMKLVSMTVPHVSVVASDESPTRQRLTIGAITYGISMYLGKRTTPTVITPPQPKA